VIRVRAANFIIDKFARERTPWGIIHPASMFKGYWNVIIMLLLVYTATIMPFRMAFLESDWLTPWFFVELMIDSLFIIDVYVNINSAYFNDEGRFIKKRNEILFAYFKSWMLIDILACVPFHLILGDEEATGTSTDTGEYKGFVRLLRLPRLYRLIRISRLFKFFKLKNERTG
jgi:hypothetical protein